MMGCQGCSKVEFGGLSGLLGSKEIELLKNYKGFKPFLPLVWAIKVLPSAKLSSFPNHIATSSQYSLQTSYSHIGPELPLNMLQAIFATRLMILSARMLAIDISTWLPCMDTSQEYLHTHACAPGCAYSIYAAVMRSRCMP